MVRRIYLKAIQITHNFFGEVLLFSEKLGLIRKLEATKIKTFTEVENIDLKYPLNFEERDRSLLEHYTGYETNDLEVFKYTHVNVSNDGAVFKRMNNSVLCFPHPMFRKRFGWLYIIGQYFFCKRQLGDQNRTYVLVFDLWAAKNYYHWLVDALPRLWLVKEDLNQNDHTLLLPYNASKFVKATLEYFEISNITVIDKDSYFTAANLILPNYAAGSGHLHPSYVKLIQAHFVAKIHSNITKQRIYVSRGKQMARRVSNEKEVIDTLLPLGFEVVYWEDLSFDEQVRTVRDTRVLVTSHGANMTNTMFMPNNSKVLELIRQDDPNFCYWALSTVTDKNYYYQLCKVVNHDDLYVNIEQFKINLHKLIHE